MGAESHALFCNFPQMSQAEHLEAAAVCKDGSVPIHELVQAARFPYDLVARPQIQVIGV